MRRLRNVAAAVWVGLLAWAFVGGPVFAEPTWQREHALYLAQRFSYAGNFPEAIRHARRAEGIAPRCRVVVTLTSRGVGIPLCAFDELRLPPAIARQVESLRARAQASPDPARAIACYQKARELDPFDASLIAPLAAALRRAGRHAEAQKVEAQAGQLGGNRLMAGDAAPSPKGSGSSLARP